MAPHDHEEIKSTDDQIDHEKMDKLFEDVMRNNWTDVVAAYQKCHRCKTAKLTKSDDTALHIAVSNERTSEALALIQELDESSLNAIRNADGNNPLHLAAIYGNKKLCAKMVEKSSNLVTARNNNGETPLFLAALHGKRDIFFYLHSKTEIREEYLRRNNGDTVLHVVISGEFLVMAKKIIEWPEKLIDAKNVDGLSPLHILAKKPNLFKSSTQFGIFDSLIYHCVAVSDAEIKIPGREEIDEYRKHSGGEKLEIGGDYPKNYQTCMDFITLLKCSFHVIVIPIKKIKQYKEFLTENSADRSLPILKEQKKRPTKRIRKRHPPANKNVVLNIISELCCRFLDSIGIFSPAGLFNALTLWRRVTAIESSPADIALREENVIKKLPLANISSPSTSTEIKEEKPHFRKAKHLYPPNYTVVILFSKLILKIFLIILGFGIGRIQEIQRKKKLHLQAKFLLDDMVSLTKSYKSYGNTGSNPGDTRTEHMEAGFSSIPDKKPQEDPNPQKIVEDSSVELDKTTREYMRRLRRKKKGKSSKRGKEQTPMLIAAKTGVTEMVEKILDKFPVAIQDVDAEQKNIVLLAIENRQPQVYKFLLKRGNIPTETVFRHVDHKGNSALHLAATQCGEYRPWLVPGSALQMQWEIKWFEYVKSSMPTNFFPSYNKKSQTPKEVFVITHKDLIKDGSEWLMRTSESCSVVAALVATVAFATSATVPGGIDEEKGTPTLGAKPAFNAFAISSLAALCFSITALVFFLSILTSRYQEKDFLLDLPRKLLLGLTSLFASIASMLLSFCAGHIFVLNRKLTYVAYPLYAALCFPITFFAFAQLSLYFDLVLSIFKKVPQRSYEVLAH